MFNKMNNNMGMEKSMQGGYENNAICSCFKPIVKESCCCRPRKVCYTVYDCCYTKKFTKKMPDNMCCPKMDNNYYSGKMNEMYDNSWGNSSGPKDNYMDNNYYSGKMNEMYDNSWGNSSGPKDNYMGDNADMYGENDMGGNYWG